MHYITVGPSPRIRNVIINGKSFACNVVFMIVRLRRFHSLLCGFMRFHHTTVNRFWIQRKKKREKKETKEKEKEKQEEKKREKQREKKEKNKERKKRKKEEKKEKKRRKKREK